MPARVVEPICRSRKLSCPYRSNRQMTALMSGRAGIYGFDTREGWTAGDVGGADAGGRRSRELIVEIRSATAAAKFHGQVDHRWRN